MGEGGHSSKGGGGENQPETDKILHLITVSEHRFLCSGNESLFPPAPDSERLSQNSRTEKCLPWNWGKERKKVPPPPQTAERLFDKIPPALERSRSVPQPGTKPRL